MIGFLRGKVLMRDVERALIDVNGVGYDVPMSLHGLAMLPADGNDVFLWIHTHVREDAFTLYGFVDELERNVFRHLISVTGIGPKMALNILGSIDTGQFVRSVADGELRRLQSVPGIGKKTAERILLDLRERMAKIVPATASSEVTLSAPINRLFSDLRSALLNLGYRPQQVDKAMEKLEDGSITEFQTLLREALKLLS